MALHAGALLTNVQPHRAKQYRDFQLEAYKNNKYISKAEVSARKKAKRRHTLLRIIAGSAAGAASMQPCSHPA